MRHGCLLTVCVYANANDVKLGKGVLDVSPMWSMRSPGMQGMLMSILQPDSANSDPHLTKYLPSIPFENVQKTYLMDNKGDISQAPIDAYADGFVEKLLGNAATLGNIAFNPHTLDMTTPLAQGAYVIQALIQSGFGYVVSSSRWLPIYDVRRAVLFLRNSRVPPSRKMT